MSGQPSEIVDRCRMCGHSAGQHRDRIAHQELNALGCTTCRLCEVTRMSLVTLVASDVDAGVEPLRDAIYKAVCASDIPFAPEVTTLGTAHACDSITAAVVNVLYERIDAARPHFGSNIAERLS